MNIASRYCFFPAEDGIRDGRVTGVQTCALPISRCLELLLDEAGVVVPLLCLERLLRSEERRVGKECSARWAPHRYSTMQRSHRRSGKYYTERTRRRARSHPGAARPGQPGWPGRP